MATRILLPTKINFNQVLWKERQAAFRKELLVRGWGTRCFLRQAKPWAIPVVGLPQPVFRKKEREQAWLQKIRLTNSESI